MVEKQGKVTGFKIEATRPEDSIAFIAIELSGCLQEEMNAKGDAKEFGEQAVRERQKAKNFSNLMITLGEYNRKKEKALKAGEVRKVSRMEPMETYDMVEIKKERLIMLERATELDEKVIFHLDIADEARKKSVELQKKLLKAK